MSEITVAEAMSHAEAAHIKIEAHEDLCAERYSHIQTNIAGVKETVTTVLKLVGWGGSTMFLIILGLLGFFATRAVSSNDSTVSHLRTQIDTLEQQQRQSRGLQGVQGIPGEQGARGDRGSDGS